MAEEKKVTGPGSFDVLGVQVAAASPASALDYMARVVAAGGRGFITLTGVHGVMEAQDDVSVKEAHRKADMCLPDGMPLVLLGRHRGFNTIERCFGPDLMLAAMADSCRKGWKHFFYGGREGVADQLKAKMERQYPGIRIVGTYCPPFRALDREEENKLKHRIEQTSPDILWVGLSTPKQELWMAEHLGKIDAPLMVGVGAAFDYNSGRLTRAPRWMQVGCLEWFYRLLCDPRRLWKRYLKNNPRFILYLVLNYKHARLQKRSD